MNEKNKADTVEMKHFNEFVKSATFKIFLMQNKKDKNCLKNIDELRLIRNYLHEKLRNELKWSSELNEIEPRIKSDNIDDIKMQIGRYWKRYHRIINAYENDKSPRIDDNGDGRRFHALEKGNIKPEEIPLQPTQRKANGLPSINALYYARQPKSPRA